MRNSLINALQTGDARTENLMVTNSTSGSFLMDLFFKMGGSRNMDPRVIENMFLVAMREDPLLTTKAMFYNRDIRGGQGERRSFRIMFNALCNIYPEIARKNLTHVPFYGRWDDLLVALGTPLETLTLDYIASALRGGDKLCAKWMPREGKRFEVIVKFLREHMHLTRKQYRKLLAGNTSVVENFMCSNEWEAINYNHVPSVASNKYRRAFGKHDYARYSEWLASLSKPESGNKIHADAIFPHTLVSGYLRYPNYRGAPRLTTNDPTIEAQWRALPDYVPDGESFLPVCDLSGSMSMGDGTAMLVSAALGIYLSERNKGPFKDAFITFSRKPMLQYLVGNLRERLIGMKLESIAENTNLEAVFQLVLRKASMGMVPPEDMPKTILILSDMQFDMCCGDPDESALKMIKRMYREAGYELPNVVFWNLRTSIGVPAKITDAGTALVSGFSPSIMTNLLGGNLSPEKVMLSTLMSERYERVVI